MRERADGRGAGLGGAGTAKRATGASLPPSLDTRTVWTLGRCRCRDRYERGGRGGGRSRSLRRFNIESHRMPW